MPNAITMLKADHTKVKGILRELNGARNVRQRERLVSELEREIKTHAQLEEEIFYPAFRDAAQARDDRELYFEAKEEHRVVDMVMPKVSEFDSEEEFAAKAKVLKDLIEHHAKEEEKEMFPKARKLFDRAELRELGDRLKERKKELMR
jgi:hemerythrin-like domain-containing protein